MQLHGILGLPVTAACPGLNTLDSGFGRLYERPTLSIAVFLRCCVIFAAPWEIPSSHVSRAHTKPTPHNSAQDSLLAKGGACAPLQNLADCAVSLGQGTSLKERASFGWSYIPMIRQS